MSNVDILGKVASKAPALAPKLGRVGLKLQKASPEILFGIGVVSVVGSVVLACRSTLKVESILDKAKEGLSDIEEGLEIGPDVYSEEDATKDKAIVYVKTAVELGKVYLPALTTLGLGIACFAGSHNIQHQRIAGLAAAYKTVEGGFKSYRNRVIEELGEEKEKEVYFDSKKEKMEIIEVDPETGKEKKVKKDVQVVDIDNVSEYARFFDSSSSQWSRNMDYNLDFLKMQQNYFNDRLHLMGHVFLNEVYDALGFERSRAGAVVGWIDGGEGDNFIDFGMTDYFYNGRLGQNYVDGKNESILLDFNVDGSIWDLI